MLISVSITRVIFIYVILPTYVSFNTFIAPPVFALSVFKFSAIMKVFIKSTGYFLGILYNPTV